MGILEQVLASIDNAKRVAGRNVSDLVSDPAAYTEKVVGNLRNSNANVVPTAAGGELTNRPMTRDEITKKYVDASMDTLSGGLGVIKPKGGNWLSGRYGPEAQLKALKRADFEPGNIWQQRLDNPNTTPEARAVAEQQLARMANPETQALNTWIDNQLTKYVKNDMGAPTDPIRKMADAWQGEKATKLAQAEAKIKALRTKQEAQAATRGVPEEYLTRTRQEVLAAEEARDLIAENRGIHFEPPYTGGASSLNVQRRREAGGFPVEGMATTDMGSAWENTADNIIGRSTVSDFQLPNNITQDPWLAKADPNAPVYSLKDGGYEPGFAHLTDELSNSLREGRLTPEQLTKMPVDQAVKHVAEINALRAVTAKKEQAMEMQGMPLHKDYPDQGMSWRQLQHEDEPTLQKWLTQEGDAMGHCVGGYCPDVQEGRSSIYSLRDAKGQPHVTIETTPGPRDDPMDWYNNAQEAEELNLPALLGVDRRDEYLQAIRQSPEYQAYLKRGPSIAQIKGKNNQAPSPEHLPFIQDFIRSGKWDQIGDTANTGLTPEEINQILKGQ
jgi:hypothetical protein